MFICSYSVMYCHQYNISIYMLLYIIYCKLLSTLLWHLHDEFLHWTHNNNRMLIAITQLNISAKKKTINFFVVSSYGIIYGTYIGIGCILLCYNIRYIHKHRLGPKVYYCQLLSNYGTVYTHGYTQLLWQNCS